MTHHQNKSSTSPHKCRNLRMVLDSNIDNFCTIFHTSQNLSHAFPDINLLPMSVGIVPFLLLQALSYTFDFFNRDMNTCYDVLIRFRRGRDVDGGRSICRWRVFPGQVGGRTLRFRRIGWGTYNELNLGQTMKFRC